MDNIDRITRKYTRLSLWIIAGITLLGLLLVQLFVRISFVNILAISAVYSLITSFLYGLAWKHIAQRSPNVLGKFYLGVSGLRMLLAFCVILLYVMVVKDRNNVVRFSIVFMLYYLAMLFFDTFYFSHIEKKRT